MDEHGVSGYSLERALARNGVRVARATILAHANGERMPRAGTVGAYAAYFNVLVDYFYAEVESQC